MTGRTTIAEPAVLEGVGLHLGVPCRLVFRPAPVHSGIRFRRVDLPGEPVIGATVRHAVLTERRTQLGEGSSALHTVEHVLAAVAGAAIDDLEIEMSSPEPPILDGSAAPFLRALRAAGLVAYGGTVHYLDVIDPLRVEDGDSWYEASAATALELDVRIEFPHPLIGRQVGVWSVTPETFASELAAARTFGFLHEVELLRGKGLIRGATTANAVVLDDEGPVRATLRWPDEFVRHKALDCVGDLALAGARVRARIVAHKPSHRGTVLLVRAMTEAQSRREACTA